MFAIFAPILLLCAFYGISPERHSVLPVGFSGQAGQVHSRKDELNHCTFCMLRRWYAKTGAGRPEARVLAQLGRLWALSGVHPAFDGPGGLRSGVHRPERHLQRRMAFHGEKNFDNFFDKIFLIIFLIKFFDTFFDNFLINFFDKFFDIFFDKFFDNATQRWGPQQAEFDSPQPRQTPRSALGVGGNIGRHCLGGL